MEPTTTRIWLGIIRPAMRMLAGPDPQAEQQEAQALALEYRAVAPDSESAGLTWVLEGDHCAQRAIAFAEALQARPVMPPRAVIVHAEPASAELSAPADLERLRRSARPGQIVASERFTRLGAALRGFERVSQDPLTFRMLALSEAGPEPTLVGRGAETDRLAACWNVTRGGRPLLIQVRGEAGIGKTRLIAEFARGLDLEVGLIRLRCAAEPQQRPFALLASLLAGRVPLTLPALESTFGLAGRDLGFMLGLEDAFVSASAAHRQFRGFMALCQWVIEQVTDHGLVLVIEDMQWLDEGSSRWLHLLLAELGQLSKACAILVLTSEWTTGQPALSCHAIGNVEVRLGALRHAEARLLLAECWRGGSETEREELLAQAQGSPLLLCELARSPRQSAGEPGSRLPKLVRSALSGRLELLSGAAHRVLSLAAVLGPDIDLSLMEALMGPEELRPGLASLEASHLLLSAERPGHLEFAHHGLYQVAYEATDPAEREAWHTRIAQWLEARDQDPLQVARHYLRTREATQAWPFLRRCAEAARLRNALAEAEMILDEAMALHHLDGRSHATRALLLAEVRLARGNAAGALDALEGLPPGHPGSDRFRRAMVAFRAYEALGEYGLAEVQLRDAHGARAASSSEPQAEVILAEASLALKRGQLARCLELAQGAQEIVAAGTSDLALAHSLCGIALYRLHGPQAALEAHATALRLREELGDLDAIGASLTNLGACYCDLGCWSEALECYERARALFEQIGESHHQAVVLNNAGNLLLQQQRFEAAEQDFRTALNLARHLDDSAGVASTLGNLGNALAARGAFTEARHLFHQAIALMESHGHREALAEAFQMAGMLEVAAGDDSQALSLLVRARDACRVSSRTGPLGIVMRGFAVLARRAGRLADAHAHVLKSIDLLSQQQMPAELAKSWSVCAEIAATLNLGEQAEQAAVQARELFERLGLEAHPALST